MPILIALLTVVVAFLVGVALMVGGHLLLGMVVALGSLPLALGVWMKMGDRA